MNNPTPLNPPAEPKPSWRFDPVDITQMRLLAQLPAGRRVSVMLNAQAFIRGTILGRLRRQYPSDSEQQLALKLLEEVSRVREIPSFAAEVEHMVQGG